MPPVNNDHGQEVTELLKTETVCADVRRAAVSGFLFAAERGYLADVELAKIGSFEAALLAYVDRDHAPLMQESASPVAITTKSRQASSIR